MKRKKSDERTKQSSSHRKTRNSAKKKGEMSNLAPPDRLSDLPLNIIHEILARAPIRDAIRTTLLSKQWRFTWATLPHLLFKIQNFMPSSFISNVLLHHKGPILSFKIYNLVNFSIDIIEEWILYLSSEDIRELTIYIDPDEYEQRIMMIDRDDEDGDIFVLKSSIYSCVKLTRLELGRFKLHPPPSSFNGFLALTSLDLIEVKLSPDAVESLVACCPVLETLRMNSCSSSEIRIRSPKLKSLHLFGEHEKICLYAPLLAEIEVGLSLPFETQTSVSNYTNLFGCFTNLVKLSGHGSFIQYLSIGIDSCHHTFVLHHLRDIKLTGVDFADTKEVSVLARIVTGAPNLHRLQISSSPVRHRLEVPLVSFKDTVCEPDITFEKLKDVSLYDVCDYLAGMDFIEFLLESSPVLETVDLYWISRKASTEILGLYRSSTNARILFTGVY